MGAGVAVGSGVAMMSMAEDKSAKPVVAAHSVKEAKLAPVSGARGFAASK